MIRAPFSPHQVACLNAYQQIGTFHPFTCGVSHEEGRQVLVARPNGFICPDEDCGYRQDWAHAFMADETWLNSWLAASKRNGGNGGDATQR